MQPEEANLAAIPAQEADPGVAVQLDLDAEGFTYQKWGGTQRCKRGDWLVNNQGEIYTVDAETFDHTCHLKEDERPGIYTKEVPVWAEQEQHLGMTQHPDGRPFGVTIPLLLACSPGNSAP